MKLIGMSCVMAGLMVAGCQKPVAQTEDNSIPNLATDTPAAPFAAQPVTTPFPELAPTGVFYLLAPVRKETKNGIIRLLPGTEVKLSRNGKYLTPEGEMDLDSKILTHDMARARMARNSDQAAQTAAYPRDLVPASAAPAAPVPTIAAAAPTATAPPLSTLTTTISSVIGAPTPAPQADADVRALKFRLSVLKSEEQKLADNLQYLSDKSLNLLRRGQPPPSGLNGSTSLTDWNLINDKLTAVRAEIRIVESRLATIPN